MPRQDVTRPTRRATVDARGCDAFRLQGTGVAATYADLPDQLGETLGFGDTTVMVWNVVISDDTRARSAGSLLSAVGVARCFVVKGDADCAPDTRCTRGSVPAQRRLGHPVARCVRPPGSLRLDAGARPARIALAGCLSGVVPGKKPRVVPGRGRTCRITVAPTRLRRECRTSSRPSTAEFPGRWTTLVPTSLR